MSKVFDKIKLLIRSRKRYKCAYCNNTGYIVTKVSPKDNKSINTLGKDMSLTLKHKCQHCNPDL